jgi:glycosyltransferase involved in cell wall biosynthesis
VTDNARSAGADRPDRPSLSLVIPAYNEAARIEAAVHDAAAWLAAQPFSTELIVVDDGSDDGTAELAERALAATTCGRVLRVAHRGKAAAVRAGMEAAGGDEIAFCDADLATPLGYLRDLRTAIASGCDLAIGSREGIGARRIGEPIYRHIMGRVFNALVRLLLVPGVPDTQCGFKLFRREAARDLLARSRLYRDESAVISGPRVTAFDVELLAIARRRGYRICPVPVVWTYGAGSKVRPARDTWHNVRDVMRVWVHARRGSYRAPVAGDRELTVTSPPGGGDREAGVGG